MSVSSNRVPKIRKDHFLERNPFHCTQNYVHLASICETIVLNYFKKVRDFSSFAIVCQSLPTFENMKVKRIMLPHSFNVRAHGGSMKTAYAPGRTQSLPGVPHEVAPPPLQAEMTQPMESEEEEEEDVKISELRKSPPPTSKSKKKSKPAPPPSPESEEEEEEESSSESELEDTSPTYPVSPRHVLQAVKHHILSFHSLPPLSRPPKFVRFFNTIWADIKKQNKNAVGNWKWAKSPPGKKPRGEERSDELSESEERSERSIRDISTWRLHDDI